MADGLHTRYQRARETWGAHCETCEPCRSKQHCSTGDPLYQRLADLQDAYLRGLRSR
ncbi:MULTISPECIES: hypothetical protein [Streptomyces]|uniref:hypothetical protein n=1 Tax=Streptomyces TaxID=1883 RepID=UPI003418DD3F